MHFPELTLLCGGHRRRCEHHGVRVLRFDAEMMENEVHLVFVLVYNPFHNRFAALTAWALIVAEFDQGVLGIRPASYLAPFGDQRRSVSLRYFRTLWRDTTTSLLQHRWRNCHRDKHNRNNSY